MSAPFQVGQRVRLNSMDRDPDPIPSGTEGTITSVFTYQIGTKIIGVDWDNGRSLNLLWPEDHFTVLPSTES
jgi:hypothetical protein